MLILLLLLYYYTVHYVLFTCGKRKPGYPAVNSSLWSSNLLIQRSFGEFHQSILSILLTAIIGDPKFGVKTSKECFDNIVNHSHSPAALALNLLDNLIPKDVQRISNVKGTNGKSPLNPMILAAIKGTCNYILHNIYLIVFVFHKIPFKCSTQLRFWNYLLEKLGTMILNKFLHLLNVTFTKFWSRAEWVRAHGTW